MIVIGDVHGCYTTLMALIDKFPEEAELCFLGDLIDRGPDSKKVVEFVKGGGHKCVLGNHEDMALQATENDCAARNWMVNGGRQCLRSYDGAIDEDHLEWFASLPYKIHHDKYIMSHSNAAAAITKVGRDAKTYTIWNRDFDEFFTDGRINIFGHTPVPKPAVRDAFIMLDTGCVFGMELSAYDTGTGVIYQQPNIEEKRS